LVHQNRRVYAVHVIAVFHEHLPPKIHDIALQGYT